MFTHLRQTAQGFFAKLILILLTGMFVVWGVGDVFRTMGAGGGGVATVGKTTVSVQQYRLALHQTNPPDPRRALVGLINSALIDNEAMALGIRVSDDDVADFIRNIPEFKDKSGNFDKNIYQAVVNQSGKSEQLFIDDIRREIAAKLLLTPLTSNVQVPEEMVQALYKTRQEVRTANLLYITPAITRAQVQAPTEQEIKDYYNTHSKNYMALEYRTLTYVTLPIDEVQAKIDVPKDEIKHTYDERKDDFRQPERRQVEDAQFDNEEDTKDAADKLAHGASFASIVASDTIINKGKTSLGMITQQQLAGGAAREVFALKEGAVTGSILLNYRWHIYHVSKIETPRADTFEEASPIIAKEIASREAQDTLVKLVNGFEDSLAGGSTLDQAAEKIGQKLQTVGPITHDGALANGDKAKLPAYDNFLSVAFSTAEKDHSQAVQAADGSYFLVRVDKVSPEHVRPLDEVKTEVTKSAMDDKVRLKLAKAGEGLSEALRKGKPAKEALAAANLDTLDFVASGPLKRESEVVTEGALKDKPLPPAMIGELFRLGAHETTHAYPGNDGAFVLATLTQVTPAPAKADPKILDGIREDLKGTLTDEILRQYLTALHNRYAITVNAAALGLKNNEEGSE